MTKEARIYNGGRDSFFNKWCWENKTATCKRMKLDHFLTLSTKIKSEWIKDLNMTPETIKLLEENIGSNLFEVSLTNIFLSMSPQAGETKAKRNYWHSIEIKSFCTTKNTNNKRKSNLLNGRRHLQRI